MQGGTFREKKLKHFGNKSLRMLNNAKQCKILNNDLESKY